MLGIVPVRKEKADPSEMVTQLLFGDTYEALETSEDKKWIKIRIDADQYEGWIDPKQHTVLSEADFNLLGDQMRQYVSNTIARVAVNGEEFIIP